MKMKAKYKYFSNIWKCLKNIAHFTQTLIWRGISHVLLFDGSTKSQSREKHIHVKFISRHAFNGVSKKYRINEDTLDRIPVKTTLSATVSKLLSVFSCWRTFSA